VALLSLNRRLGVSNPNGEQHHNESYHVSAGAGQQAELTAAVVEARDAVGARFEHFCLMAGLASLAQMLEEYALALVGAPHVRAVDKPDRTRGSVGFHGGKVEIERPRVHSKAHCLA